MITDKKIFSRRVSNVNKWQMIDLCYYYILFCFPSKALDTFILVKFDLLTTDDLFPTTTQLPKVFLNVFQFHFKRFAFKIVLRFSQSFS